MGVRADFERSRPRRGALFRYGQPNSNGLLVALPRGARRGFGVCAFASCWGRAYALAMTGAYVLAGELAVAEGENARAFERYECVLGAFIDGKQKAAEQVARSFVPRTRFGLLVHNQLSKALQFPACCESFDRSRPSGSLDAAGIPVA